MKAIAEIRIERIADNCADLDSLGEYSDTRAEKFGIERKQCQRGEFKFFNAANVSNRAEALENFKRAEAFNAGEWQYIGVRAVALVTTGKDNGPRMTHVISSAGLWGVESDSGEEYLADLAADELFDLSAILTEFGFTQEQITEAREASVKILQRGPIGADGQFRMID